MASADPDGCARFIAASRNEAQRHHLKPMDLRAGTETALILVVAVFGTAKPQRAYLLANRRANRMKVLVHNGLGIWLAARRLNQGTFQWPGTHRGLEVELDAEHRSCGR